MARATTVLCIVGWALLLHTGCMAPPAEAPSESMVSSLARAFDGATVQVRVYAGGAVEGELTAPGPVWSLRWEPEARAMETSRNGRPMDAVALEAPSPEGVAVALYARWRRSRDPGAPACEALPRTVCTTSCCAELDRCVARLGCEASGDPVRASLCDACEARFTACLALRGTDACLQPAGSGRACEAQECGCGAQSCYDPRTNASYCASACLAPGELPEGTRPGDRGVLPPAAARRDPPAPPAGTGMRFVTCECVSFSADEDRCGLRVTDGAGGTGTVSARRPEGRSCDGSACMGLFYAAYGPQCAVFTLPR
ncbi:MAG: hypothetical protein HY909_23690 [Deltaproteobacteria bacterium]|nr:hypothetical protein [Deltaproteobacteria bacterium]